MPMITYKLQKNEGQYFTEPILDEEEWYQVLSAADNSQHRRQLDVLRMFLCQPDHKSTCARLGKVYSMSDSSINMLVQHFGKYVQKSFGKDFRVEANENAEDTYWPITMLGRQVKGGHFEWEMRPELVAALQRYLREKLIREYRGPVIAEGLNNSRSNEIYKWEIIASAQGKTTEEIIRILVSKDCNFVEKPHTGATIMSLLESSLDKVLESFDLLLQDKPLNDRLQDFIKAAKAITPAGKSSYGDERTAAAFLGCLDPQTYAPYTSTIYEDYCKYLGVTIKPVGQKYAHFLELLKEIIPLERQDMDLQNMLHRDTDSLCWSELVNAQDVLWQMQGFMESIQPKNWLQQIYDEAIRSNADAFSWWYPQYKESVHLFLGMFSEGNTAESVPEETIDYFIRAQQNWVCNNGQGCFTYEEYPRIRQMWPEIYGILKKNVAGGEISSEDFNQLEQLIRPSLKTNHPVAYHRLWSALFPEKLTTCCKDNDFAYAYDTTRKFDESLPLRSGNWLDDNLTFMRYLGEKVTFLEPWHRAIFARYLYDNLSFEEKHTNMDQYTELLRANRNIVLTGAPGTGKTYLAQMIAKEMRCSEDEVGFVQFHPSYDYTDFVEGLRPFEDENGNVVFERRDGVFKEFCAKAFENLLNSKKSLQTLQQETSVRDLIEDFIQDAIESDTQFETQGRKNAFHIIDNRAKTITIEIPKNEKARVISLPKSDLIALLENKVAISGSKEIQVYFKRKYRTQQDSYTYVLYNKLRNKKLGTKTEVALVPRKNFVFIIDEINRGELSKIFGELFFAIDPDYRGTKGRLKTQYQNLVEPGDPFEEGFFVPDNVYIIGTMNDIDRGVESMDFAIRRRFAWVEVKAEDRLSMLDEKIPEWSEAAQRSMISLNKALKDKSIGLTSAYDIGPSYFLKLAQYNGDFEKLWKYHIKGVIEEYLRGNRGIDEKEEALKKAFDVYKG